MLVSIQKIHGNADKFNAWTDKFNAVKSALFNQPDETDFEFTKIILRDVAKDENAHQGSQHDLYDDNSDAILSEIEVEERTVFLNNRIKDKILAKWEVQGENGPMSDYYDGLTSDEFDSITPHEKPLLLGFNEQNDYVELEYMVVPDPVTGQVVTPQISVKSSYDGSSGDVYLNGKLVKSIAGAKDLQASNIKLVMIAG